MACAVHDLDINICIWLNESLCRTPWAAISIKGNKDANEHSITVDVQHVFSHISSLIPSRVNRLQVSWTANRMGWVCLFPPTKSELAESVHRSNLLLRCGVSYDGVGGLHCSLEGCFTYNTVYRVVCYMYSITELLLDNLLDDLIWHIPFTSTFLSCISCWLVNSSIGLTLFAAFYIPEQPDGIMLHEHNSSCMWPHPISSLAMSAWNPMLRVDA